jgi:hypothetical protein
MPAANPITGPYTYTQQIYHQESAKYNRTVLANATFFATGAYANPSAFYVSGSTGATVTLTDGGTIAIPAAAAATPAQVFEMSVYSVTAGTVYLLYRG